MPAPARPRRIFLAVTGVSPQIVTESLYALATDETQPFIPDEIHIVTTGTGRRHIMESLIERGHFAALLRDYPALGRPQFGAENIHVIQTTEGQELDDICTPQENSSAADSITALICRLTSDPRTSLHVSISGGRKTMGFYVGYAFSLFARRQDALSHVLVSPAEFESCPDFFYPPAQPREITIRSGKSINTASARITLAHIPIVRLREGVPQRLLSGHASYSATVAAIQQSFEEPHLAINLRDKSATCGSHPLTLRPITLAWLAWWAHLAKRGAAQQSWRELADIPALRDTFLDIYERILKGSAKRVSDAAQETLDKTRARLMSDSKDTHHADCRAFFQENNAKLAKQLRAQLGPAAHHYLLQSSGKRPHTRHALSLAAAQIDIIGMDSTYPQQ